MNVHEAAERLYATLRAIESEGLSVGPCSCCDGEIGVYDPLRNEGVDLRPTSAGWVVVQ